MEKFYGKHSAKLEAIEIGLAEATEKVSKIVNDFAESRKISKEEALVKLEKVSGQTQVTYPSGQIGKINHSDIVKKMKDENHKRKSSVKGPKLYTINKTKYKTIL